MEPTSKTDDTVKTSASFDLRADASAPEWFKALLIENDRLRRENSALVDRMARLQAVAAGLVRSLTVQDVVETVVREGIQALNAVNGMVHLVSPDGQWLESPFALGASPETVRNYQRIPVDAPVPQAQTFRERRRIIIGSKSAARALFPAITEASRISIAQAWLALPILSGDSAIGSIVFGFGEHHPITEEDEALGTALSQQCAVALERARLFEAERSARARADEANRAKMDFLAVMSHELRTPLNAIGGYAQLLEMGIHGPANEQQQEVITRIQRSQQHLLRLINDVLSFAKIDAGRVEMTLRDVRVHELMLGLEPMIIPLMTQRGLDYQYEPIDQSVTMYVDADKTQQIMLNLLSNAAKFTPLGGTIRVEAAVRDETVEITVSDTGRGIPADKLEKIFEPFVQLDGGKTRSHEGTGLGLAISRDLARAMEGDIEVESELGKGSMFVLRLPRGKD